VDSVALVLGGEEPAQRKRMEIIARASLPSDLSSLILEAIQSIGLSPVSMDRALQRHRLWRHNSPPPFYRKPR
jgi:hypothetical protein